MKAHGGSERFVQDVFCAYSSFLIHHVDFLLFFLSFFLFNGKLADTGLDHRRHHGVRIGYCGPPPPPPPHSL